MQLILRSAMVLSLCTALVVTTARAADAPSIQDSANHTTFTWRAWADGEYLAERDASMDAARLCTKASGTVVNEEVLGTRMLGNGSWHATARVTCLRN
jgi:hypothetical protein